MKTQLITLQVSVQAPPSKLRSAVLGAEILSSDALRSRIETRLSTHGDPLRWAITHLTTDPTTQQLTAHIEAVVTTL
ncbi:MAG: hypothetical protein AAFO84_12955 [Cyanobacteria bacterium J06598_1]